jgi:glycerophosphoryl diester phosphodiesterase
VPTRRTALTGLAAATLAVAVAPSGPAPAQAVPAAKGPKRPLVIGHRGASGYRPEHTLAAYELAARLGADFIEPDLCATGDGILVARHEPEIGGTTDVAGRPEFAGRRATKLLDGVPVTGWWTEDFTLAELKTLRAVERLPAVRQENTLYDGRFQVPTFQEVLDLRARLSRELGREVGVYPETKHPTRCRQLGLALEPRLLDALRRNGLNHSGAPVYVQSFETTNLQLLRRLGLRTRVVQLTSAAGAPYDLVAAGDPRSYADLTTPAGLRGIARYADGVGPDKQQVIPWTAAGELGTSTGLVTAAHAAGLVVHPYTFRPENQFLPAALRTGPAGSDYGRLLDELAAYLRAGVDGFFTDTPDLGVLARSEFLARSPVPAR